MAFEIKGDVAADEIHKFEQLSQERKFLQGIGSLPHWYTTQGWQMFSEKYSVEGESAVYGRHRQIARTLVKHLPMALWQEWEEKFFNILWKGILSPASPALGNTGTDRGMMVSCAGQVVGNSVDDFYKSLHEMAMLSKHGFGTSADFSQIQGRGTPFGDGGKANGAVEVINDFFDAAKKISQGGRRRGSVGAYLDADHPDFWEAITELKLDNNGKNYGWTIRDEFIERLKAGDEETKTRFKEMLYVKLLTGKGYLFFVDKANRHRPEMYKKHGLKIIATNLCSEIMLHSSKDLTYSCILASLNLIHWNEIKETDAAFVAMVFLDCLCSEFIMKSEGKSGLEKVREFTIKGRAVGLGVMGLGTYFQQEMIPYESLQAQFIDNEVFKHIHDETLRASKWLAEILGEPEWCEGFGVRNTHRTALAPTKSTALLMGGVSESWFPDPGMIFDAGSAVGELRRITPEFYELMKRKGVYSTETIEDIINHMGSVQHVDWLTDEEKLVFKTAFEMDQRVIYRRARNRQKWLCQGQSLNFWFAEGAEELISEIMTLCLLDEEILSVYYAYLRSGVVVTDECIACAA